MALRSSKVTIQGRTNPRTFIEKVMFQNIFAAPFLFSDRFFSLRQMTLNETRRFEYFFCMFSNPAERLNIANTLLFYMFGLELHFS